jgi:hypothetical protein
MVDNNKANINGVGLEGVDWIYSYMAEDRTTARLFCSR